MRGQRSFLVKQHALRRFLVAVLTVLLPLAAIAVFAGNAMAQGPVKLHLDHWGNGGSPQTVAKWRDGNLHWTNSHYQEGDADPTRFIMDDLTPGQEYSLTFTFMAAKKQAKVVKHGHDFLTNYTFSEYPTYTPNTATAPAGLPSAAYPDPCLPRVQGGGKPPYVCTPGSKPTDVYAIPIDTFGNGQLKVSDRQNAAGVPQYFAMWNGDITAVSGYSYSPTTIFKDTTYVTLTVTFTAGNPAAGEGVVLAFGGHLAKSTNPPSGWGAGQGAGDINGAPYHWAYNLVAKNGQKVAQGARNRSIMIRRDGHIQIVKSCVNVDSTDTDFPNDFPFTASNPANVQDGLPSSFTLDRDSETGTIEQSSVITGGSGQYSISESPLPGYAVTAIVCSIYDGQGNVTGTKNLTITPSLPVANPGTVTATFDFSAGETVRCVFTNTKPTAYITLTPNEATNLLNQQHEITAHVYKNSGSGAVNAVGVLVTFSLVAVPPDDTSSVSFVNNINTCTTGAAGTCSVKIVSAEAVVVDIHAEATVNVIGVDVDTETGTHVKNDLTTDARKQYREPNDVLLRIVKCVVNNTTGTKHPTDFLFRNGTTDLPWGTYPDFEDAACPTGYTGEADGFVYKLDLVMDGQGNIIPVNYNITERDEPDYTQVFRSSTCQGTVSTEAAPITCIIVNDDDLLGRMTGGGSVFYPKNAAALIAGKKEGNVRITHGFELHCTDVGLPNRLEVVWHDGADAFHLETLTSAKCTQVSNPPDQEQPESYFDTFEGEGFGRINSNPSALYRIKFKLTDHGEPAGKDLTPNSLDTAEFEVTNTSNTQNPLFLSSYGSKPLEQGNHQAHLENK